MSQASRTGYVHYNDKQRCYPGTLRLGLDDIGKVWTSCSGSLLSLEIAEFLDLRGSEIVSVCVDYVRRK